MNKKNFVPILFSVIAILLLTTAVVCVVLSSVNHIKRRNAPVTTDDLPQQTTAAPTKETPEEPTSFGKEPVETPETQPAEPTCKSALPKTDDAGQDYIDGLVFLGDSTTYGMINAAVLKDKKDTRQVWYGPGGTLTLPAATSHLLNDGSPEAGKVLFDMAKEKQPKIIVVTLGVGVSYSLAEEQFKAAYEAVIDQILEIDTVLAASPKTKIICNSIYPVAAVLSDNYRNINNEDIRKANGWISEVADKRFEEGQQVYYLDSYTALSGKDGYLPVNYTNGDGLHLSASAFNALLKNLRVHALKDAA